MTEILTSEFFWGIIIGLILSLVGGWALAHFTAALHRNHQRKLVSRLCLDTAKNVRSIAERMDEVKSKTALIHGHYLDLIESELAVFERNREHLVLLSETDAESARRFFADVAASRAEVLTKLHEFQQNFQQSKQIEATGRGPEAQRILQLANDDLEDAKAAADRLLQCTKSASGFLKI